LQRATTGMARTSKKRRNFIAVSQALLLDAMPEDLGMDSDTDSVDMPPLIHRERKHRPVNDIFNEQGPTYVWRAYRMNATSFWTLHRLVNKAIIKSPATATEEPSTKTHKMEPKWPHIILN
jgi:hypothetical protein